MASESGCTLVSAHQVGGELVGQFDCPDIDEGRPLATAQLLQGLTADDATLDALDPAIVLSVRSAGPLAPEAAHAYVQAHVAYVDEPEETFATPNATFASGVGDCDDSARALLALAGAAGVPGRLVFFLQDGQPAHVAAQLQTSDGAWHWAETTIAARFGEHPFAALDRLGMRRPDLDGTPVLLNADGSTTPLTSRSMGSMDQLVDRVATPVTSQGLADALAAAWPAAIGGSPGSAINVLVAQSAFETGAWKAVWNNNLGNVKYTSGTDYFQMTASEGSGANTTMVPSKWRSYPTLAAGAAAWLKFMSNNESSAMTFATSGDVADFVSALKNNGYFTGDLGQYTAGVQQYYSQYSGITPSATAGQAQAVAQTVTDGQTSLDTAIGVVVGGVVAGALAALLL
jgi:Transglutaminase-like superfamily